MNVIKWVDFYRGPIETVLPGLTMKYLHSEIHKITPKIFVPPCNKWYHQIALFNTIP